MANDKRFLHMDLDIQGIMDRQLCMDLCYVINRDCIIYDTNVSKEFLDYDSIDNIPVIDIKKAIFNKVHTNFGNGDNNVDKEVIESFHKCGYEPDIKKIMEDCANARIANEKEYQYRYNQLSQKEKNSKIAVLKLRNECTAPYFPFVFLDGISIPRETQTDKKNVTFYSIATDRPDKSVDQLLKCSYMMTCVRALSSLPIPTQCVIFYDFLWTSKTRVVLFIKVINTLM
jgi:hypothetical protein